jgi:hypothetical protein
MTTQFFQFFFGWITRLAFVLSVGVVTLSLAARRVQICETLPTTGTYVMELRRPS